MLRHQFIARQSSCPSGLIGNIVAGVMSAETVRENEITLDLLELNPTDQVLEIGFGHGRTLGRVAGLVSEGFVAGIDISPTMLRMAARRNRRSLQSGRLELREADAACIPYPDGRFDKAFAMHTLYFWSHPSEQFREIRRVLRRGGRFILGFRYDNEAIKNFPAPIYTFRRPDDVRNLMVESGLDHIHIEERQLEARRMYWAIASYL